MGKKRWFRFYIDQWRSGVVDLKPHEQAAYLTVLCELYDKDGFAELNEVVLARRCNMRPARFKACVDALVLKGKLDIQSGFLTNKTVTQEVQSREKLIKKGVKKRKHSSQTATKSEPNRDQTELNKSINSIGVNEKQPHNTLNSIKNNKDCASLTGGVCGTSEQSIIDFRKRRNLRKIGY